MADSRRSLWKFRVSAPVRNLGNGTHELTLELFDPLASVKFNQAPAVFRLIVNDDQMRPLLELAENAEGCMLELRREGK